KRERPSETLIGHHQARKVEPWSHSRPGFAVQVPGGREASRARLLVLERANAPPENVEQGELQRSPVEFSRHIVLERRAVAGRVGSRPRESQSLWRLSVSLRLGPEDLAIDKDVRVALGRRAR